MVKHMKKSGCKPGEVTYRTLVDAYCKLGRYEDVERILKFIKQADPNFDKAAFRRIAARVSEYDRQPSYLVAATGSRSSFYSLLTPAFIRLRYDTAYRTRGVVGTSRILEIHIPIVK